MLLFPARRVGQVSLQRESIWIETITKNCWFWCLLNSWCRIFFLWGLGIDAVFANDINLLIPEKLYWFQVNCDDRWCEISLCSKQGFVSCLQIRTLQPCSQILLLGSSLHDSVLWFNDTQVLGGLSHFLPTAQRSYVLLSSTLSAIPEAVLASTSQNLSTNRAFPPVVLPQGLDWGKLYSLLGCKGTPGLDWCWYTLMLPTCWLISLGNTRNVDELWVLWCF